MSKYELMVILSASMEDEAREKLVQKIQSLVETNNGTVDNVDKWGIKKFAYPINYKNEGYYVVMQITCEPSLPNAVEKQLLLTENVVRSMFVKM